MNTPLPDHAERLKPLVLVVDDSALSRTQITDFGQLASGVAHDIDTPAQLCRVTFDKRWSAS